MAKKRRELSGVEWRIIRAVWENQPCSAPEVQEMVWRERKWAYSTVKTIMDRMAGKGLLKTKRVRNVVQYRAALTRSQAQKSEVKRTMKRVFDGELMPMVQFLLENNKLSKKELDEIERMIKKKRRRR